MTGDLHEQTQRLRAIFDQCSDVVFREIKIASRVKGVLVYLDGIVNTRELHDNAIRPLLLLHAQKQALTPELMEEQGISLSQITHAVTEADVVDAILTGNAALLIEGYAEALILSVRGGEHRSVSEPLTESVVRGPREGFTEHLRTNTGLLRRKIKSSQLKLTSLTIGEQTQTVVVLAYIDGIVEPAVIAEVLQRLRDIHIDGVLESGYIEEFIQDEPLSPFPQMQYTERPDTVAAQLLEGHFAIFVDGTPFVLTGPVTFWQMMQASEDYYERYLLTTLIRWLRYIFLFVALFMPSLYIAITTFHQDMLPTSLLLSIAAARESIPFPALVEALIMEVAFEALREAGIRLPKTIGQAVSILGALVIGQAAVEAGIVSAPMVIVVSLTGLASFTIPRFNAAIAVRILRFPLMFLGGAFGLFGIVIGTTWIVLHLSHLRSFGVPYLSGLAPSKKGEWKDILVRAPWPKMRLRPLTYTQRHRKRVDTGRKGGAE